MRLGCIQSAHGPGGNGGSNSASKPLSCIILAVFVALAWLGCAPVRTQETSTPFERAQIFHREHLEDSGLVRLSARREGTRVAVRLESVAFCRDDLLVSRGLEVTKHRSLSTTRQRGEWIVFGGFVGFTVLGTAVYSGTDCSPEATVCADKGLAYLAAVAAAAGAVVSGSVLLIDHLRATDTTESIAMSRSAEQRTTVCGVAPRSGATVQAGYNGVRSEASTNEEGKAFLELGLPPGPLADIPVHLTLDGAPLGALPLTSEWRSAVLHR